MNRPLVVLAGLWLGFSPLAGQSVSPPIAEYQERARSSFQLHNASLFPITAVLEVRGFTITEHGEVVDTPLDTSRIRVKLSQMSFRIAPRGTHTVFYEASADSVPAWFNIVSALTGTRTASGLNVRILLPHVVYLNQKQALRREDVAIRRFEVDTPKRKARVQLENLSPRLGRVYQLQVKDDDRSGPVGGGFPLLPRTRRWAEVEWSGATPPTRLLLRFARFTIDTTITALPAALATDSASAPRP
jgi:hypothetical protein